jgi:hypothetical protein
MTDDPYIIWSFEHHAWWRPGGWGYTPDLREAGHYPRAEAEAMVAQANIVHWNETMLPLREALDWTPREIELVLRYRAASVHRRALIDAVIRHLEAVDRHRP